MSLKSFIPHFIAIGIFLAVTISYFSPVIFGGKEIFQEDIMRFKGISKEVIDFREKTGQEALWTNSSFCGMPAYQISVIYISGYLKYLNKIFSLGLPHPAQVIFITFLGFYFLLLVLSVNPWLAIAGALGYGLSSYLFIVIDAGHNTKAMAMAYMAPVLAGMFLIYRKKILYGFAALSLFLTLEIYCNHPQITYYLGLLFVIYVITELVFALKEKRIFDFVKRSALAAAAGILAVGVNITNLLVTADYSRYTIRGGTELTINPDGTKNEHNVTSGLDKDYATAWSYGIGETMTLLIPNFKGGASAPIGENKSAMKSIDPEMRESVSRMPAYFGTQPFTSGPVYAGAIVLFLFVLGIFLPFSHSPALSSQSGETRNEKNNLTSLKWTLIISTLLSIWLSWGRNDPFGLSNFMLDHFPAYNKFRAVAMTLVIAGICIPLLGTLAIDSILRDKSFLQKKIILPFRQTFSGQKILIASFILTGGISLLCWLAPGIFTDFSSPGESQELFMQIKQSNPDVQDQQIKAYLEEVFPVVESARQSIVKADALRSFIFILLATLALWLYLKIIVSLKILALLFAALIIVDMASVDWRYLNEKSFVKRTEMKNPFAIAGRPNQADLQILEDKELYFRVWNTFSRPDQDAATSYFHKSISGYHGAKLRRYQELIDFHINRRNREVINMLNAKYFIIPDEQGQPSAYLNQEAMGNAWFVNEYKIVANADLEILALKNFNPATTAILDKRFENEVKGFVPQKDSSASVKLISYKPNQLIYESINSKEGLAVFSEIYYPSTNGWNAYIDGKSAAHFRVNYVLRAMRVPAGKHQIEYKFEPKIYDTGEKISTASIILLFLLSGVATFMELKRKTPSHPFPKGREE